MRGTLALTCQKGDITLQRDTARANSPMGRFSAVYTGSGETVDGLTAADCGETLLGVPCEVYERSAFIRQSSLTVDASTELERRIAALITTGEEGSRSAKRPPRSKSSSTPANTTSPAASPRSRPRSAHRSARSRNWSAAHAQQAQGRGSPRLIRCRGSLAARTAPRTRSLRCAGRPPRRRGSAAGMAEHRKQSRISSPRAD